MKGFRHLGANKVLKFAPDIIGFLNDWGTKSLRAHTVPTRSAARSPNQKPTQCLLQAKLDVFVAECETDVSERKCTDKCARRFADTLMTSRGAAFSNCTCWRQDPLCDHLNDHILAACMERAASLIDGDNSNFTKTNSIKDSPATTSGNGSSTTATADANISLPAISTVVLSSLSTLYYAMFLRR